MDSHAQSTPGATNRIRTPIVKLKSTQVITQDEIYEEFALLWPRLYRGIVRHFGWQYEDEIIRLIQESLIERQVDNAEALEISARRNTKRTGNQPE